ncbi:hypothetical protein GOP47_0009498 [Adiantum capillus-veneris]|uniref:Uncharacterized protein n=1 Tax=Adiantum capillus-veneris TaxID=13818 RepID=A0A9D4UX79_ADICA|nr:hypothetical protein GOP47_0009498 [Adiantum capillus-veneris]
MEELHMSHSRIKEQRAGAPHERNHQQSRVSHASKCAPTMALSPSIQSPTSPFVHLDSTSTASLSHLAPRSHSSAHNALRLNPSQSLTTESDASSTSACHATSPHEVPIEDVFSERVSLEKHLQHGDAGREEALQSFILERFLPAAKIVAADHDRTMYSSGRHPIMTMPSTVRYSSATMKDAPVHSKKSPSNVAWSRSFYEDDEDYNDSVSSEMPAKSCGFFCAGLKSAMSRSNNIAHQSLLRNKSRVPTQSSSHGTSSDEEDLLPKVKVMMQGTQKQRGIFGPAPASFATRSPTPPTIQDSERRRAANLNKSFARGPAGNSVQSLTHLNSRPSLNLCIKCHNSSSFLRQTPMKGPSLGDGIAFQQGARTLRGPCNDGDVGCDCHNAQQTPVELNANDSCPWNASNPQVSSQDSSTQVHNIKERLYVFESGLRDQRRPEDDELEFYDALSRFDMSISTQSSVPPLEDCESPSQNPHVSLTSHKHNSVATNLLCPREGEILAFDGDREGCVEVPSRYQPEKSGKEKLMDQHNSRVNSQQGKYACARPEKSGKENLMDHHNSSENSQQGKYACARPFDGAYSSRLKSSGKNTKSSSSSMPGWPLGISSFQSSTRKALPQETKNFSDECAANSKVRFATMADELRTDHGRSLAESSTVCASTEVGIKHSKNSIASIQTILCAYFGRGREAGLCSEEGGVYFAIGQEEGSEVGGCGERKPDASIAFQLFGEKIVTVIQLIEVQ